MRLPIAAVVVTFVGGGLVWAAGAITELGSVSAESTDPSQRARVMADVPGWVGIAKPLGLTLMAAAVVAAAVSRFRRK